MKSERSVIGGARGALIVATLVAVIAGLLSPAHAQNPSPLTLQPSTGRVGVGTTTPGYTLDVSGTVNAASFRGDGSQLSGTGGGHGQVRLRLNGTNLELCPYAGNKIIVGDASVGLASCVVRDAVGLAANTTYYVYLFDDAGTLRLDASTTGYTVGATGIAYKTGSSGRTLVGMARTIDGGAWVDSERQRFVLSYFNRRRIGARSWVGGSGWISSTTFVELIPSTARVEFLTWGDEAVFAFANAPIETSQAGTYYLAVAFDGPSPDYGATHATEPMAGYAVALSLHTVAPGLGEGYHFLTLAGRVGVGSMYLRGGGSPADGAPSYGVLIRG